MEEFILVLNTGSSSLKYAVFSTKKMTRVFKGHVDGIGLKSCVLRVTKDKKEVRESFVAKDHLHAILKCFASLKHYGIVKDFSQIVKVGHRVVHGGERFVRPTKITKRVIGKIKELSILAPLHNPPALAGILSVQKILKSTPQYAVFDTSFHHSIPKQAFLYGLPMKLYTEHGIRKYGFHGISHEYVSRQAAKVIGKSHSHEMISCHLGNGSSIAAIKNGKSIDTSMGFTPLDGLIMGTRSGDLDPAIVLYLLKQGHYSVKEAEDLLEHESGLKGVSGMSDIRSIYAKSKEKDEQAVLALNMLSYRIAQYIGSYAAALKGLDAIVFTGGIGENAFYIRRKTCSYLSFLGLELNAHANRKNEIVINTKKSKVKVLVVPTDEEAAIAKAIA